MDGKTEGDRIIENKMTDFFGNEGLIIYAKSNEYYKTNLVKMDEIKKYYGILNAHGRESYSLPHKICCLFYLTREDINYSNDFMKLFSAFVSSKNEEKEENLYTVYNMIDYEAYYDILEEKDKKKLRTKFEFFENKAIISRRITQIIYIYFRANLLFIFNEYDFAYFQSCELTEILNKRKNRDQLSKFIKLKNRLIPLLVHENSETLGLGEAITFLKDLYNDLEKTDSILMLKTGLELYDRYFENGNFKECEDLYIKLKDIINESKDKISAEKFFIFNLAIISRKEFFTTTMNEIQNLMNKNISEVDSYIKNKIKNINSGELKLDLIESNVAMLTEHLVHSFMKKIQKEEQNFKITPELFFPFLLGTYYGTVHNYNLYFAEPKNQSKYGLTIISLSDSLAKYLELYGKEEPLFKNQLSKSIYMKITSILAHLYLNSGDFENLKKAIENFDKNSKIIEIEPNNPDYGYIAKIKSDLTFLNDKNKTNDLIDDVIKNYETNNFEKAILYFNKALNIISQGVVGESKDLLLKAKDLINSLPEKDKNSNIVQSKIKVIDDLLEKIKNCINK